MPWAPELFSAPALERAQEKRQDELVAVPYFDGLLADEPDALVKSFAALPEVYVPLRGRVKGTRAFEAFVSETHSWLKQHNASVADVEHVITERHGFEEVVLQLDGQTGRVEVPVAIVADRRSDGRIEELRIYFSNWPFDGRHVNRPPLLQRDPQLLLADVVGEYQRALAAGDVDAIAASFEADGYAREPAGTYTEVPTACARSTSSCSQTGAASLWSTAPRSTMGGCVCSSTTWCAGAGRSCRRKPGSPPIRAVRTGGSPRHASTTTAILRSPPPSAVTSASAVRS
jgi:hypothetical protein